MDAAVQLQNALAPGLGVQPCVCNRTTSTPPQLPARRQACNTHARTIHVLGHNVVDDALGFEPGEHLMRA